MLQGMGRKGRVKNVRREGGKMKIETNEEQKMPSAGRKK